MIESFQISPTSRSSCVGCKKKIEKGEARGKENYTFGRYNSHRYYCLKCSKIIIEDFLKEAGQYIDFK
jgi:hypothetical protein